MVVPVLGSRRSLVAACCLYSLAPVLGWLVLGAASPDLLALTYGLLSAVTVNFILLLTFTIPATWFPQEHRGKVDTSTHLVSSRSKSSEEKCEAPFKHGR